MITSNHHVTPSPHIFPHFDISFTSFHAASLTFFFFSNIIYFIVTVLSALRVYFLSLHIFFFWLIPILFFSVLRATKSSVIFLHGLYRCNVSCVYEHLTENNSVILLAVNVSNVRGEYEMSQRMATYELPSQTKWGKKHFRGFFMHQRECNCRAEISALSDRGRKRLRSGTFCTFE